MARGTDQRGGRGVVYDGLPTGGCPTLSAHESFCLQPQREIGIQRRSEPGKNEEASCSTECKTAWRSHTEPAESNRIIHALR